MIALRGSVKRKVDAWLLHDVERRAAERSAAHAAWLRVACIAAERREDGARSLVDLPEAVAAISLLREASLLLLGAIASADANEPGEDPARSDRPTHAPSVAWAAFDRACAERAVTPPAYVARARKVLAHDDPLVAEHLASADLFDAREAAIETVAWLRTQVDARSVRQVRVVRALRVATLVLVVAAAAYLVVGRIRAPRNIARGGSVTVSSQIAGAPSALALTNGALEASFAVHTQTQSDAWVMVDLGAPRAIFEVRIFNRADGWEDECLPLVLELSDDGTFFREVDRRDAPFTQADPWLVALGGARARYVRVHHPGAGYVALSEIEVYGTR